MSTSLRSAPRASAKSLRGDVGLDAGLGRWTISAEDFYRRSIRVYVPLTTKVHVHGRFDRACCRISRDDTISHYFLHCVLSRREWGSSGHFNTVAHCYCLMTHDLYASVCALSYRQTPWTDTFYCTRREILSSSCRPVQGKEQFGSCHRRAVHSIQCLCRRQYQASA